EGTERARVPTTPPVPGPAVGRRTPAPRRKRAPRAPPPRAVSRRGSPYEPRGIRRVALRFDPQNDVPGRGHRLVVEVKLPEAAVDGDFPRDHEHSGGTGGERDRQFLVEASGDATPDAARHDRLVGRRGAIAGGPAAEAPPHHRPHGVAPPPLAR